MFLIFSNNFYLIINDIVKGIFFNLIYVVDNLKLFFVLSFYTL